MGSVDAGTHAPSATKFTFVFIAVYATNTARAASYSPRATSSPPSPVVVVEYHSSKNAAACCCRSGCTRSPNATRRETGITFPSSKLAAARATSLGQADTQALTWSHPPLPPPSLTDPADSNGPRPDKNARCRA